MTKLIRVSAPDFVAHLRFQKNVCIKAPPRLIWMQGWQLAECAHLWRKKGWRFEVRLVAEDHC